MSVKASDKESTDTPRFVRDRLLVAKFADIRLDIDAIHVDSDTVTVRSAVAGTEVLVFGAAPILIEVFRDGNGRFTEWWGSTWLPDLGWRHRDRRHEHSLTGAARGTGSPSAKRLSDPQRVAKVET